MSVSDASPASLNAVEVQSDEDDLLFASKNAKKLSSAEVKAFREAALEDIARTDVLVQSAVDAFFDNRTVDCQKILDDNKFVDPLIMTGAGLIAFVRYMLSMEQEQADIALRDINEGSAFSSQVLPSGKGLLSKLSWKKASLESKWLKPGEYRAKTVHTEAQALRAFALVLQGNVMSYVKAGLALRRAYIGYTSLNRERDERMAAACAKLTSAERDALGTTVLDIGIDRNSLYSVDLGLAAINMAISILPDSILRMVRVLGLAGDRQEGIDFAKRCFESKTLLSSFAGAMLLGLLGALPLACSLLVDMYTPTVRKLIDETLTRDNVNGSLLHLWLIARAELITRDLDRSTELMLRCVTISESGQIKQGMPQLRNFVYFDLSCTYIMQHAWEKAREAFVVLAKDSRWSDLYYNYAQACCYESMARECEQADGTREEINALWEKASQQYWYTLHQKGTKMGGKLRATDQFVAKRLDEMMELRQAAHPNKDYKEKIELTPMPKGLRLRNTVFLPSYELIFLYNLSLRIPRDIMKSMVARIDFVLEKENLVRSQRSLQEAAEADRLAGQEARRVATTAAASGASAGVDEEVGDDDDENASEENFDDHSNTAEATPAKGTTNEKKDPIQLPSGQGHVSLGLHVHAINQASAAYASELTKKSSRSPPGTLPSNYQLMALSGTKACLLANSTDAADREDGLQLVNAILAAPVYKDKAWSLSFIQPFLLYEKVCALFYRANGRGREEAEAIIRDFDKKYPDPHYYFHTTVDVRVHLAKCQFRDEKKTEAAKEKEKKASTHADPNA